MIWWFNAVNREPCLTPPIVKGCDISSSIQGALGQTPPTAMQLTTQYSNKCQPFWHHCYRGTACWNCELLLCWIYLGKHKNILEFSIISQYWFSARGWNALLHFHCILEFRFKYVWSLFLSMKIYWHFLSFLNIDSVQVVGMLYCIFTVFLNFESNMFEVCF